jgi:low affinity Fe/Cu permease
MRWFDQFAKTTTIWAGSPIAVFGSVLIVVVWALTGPVFQFSDTWQLVINTTTTILTFNMVFLIQATQNRDGRATHIKLDEIIEALNTISNRAVAIEDAAEEEMEQMHADHLEKKETSDG